MVDKFGMRVLALIEVKEMRKGKIYGLSVIEFHLLRSVDEARPQTEQVPLMALLTMGYALYTDFGATMMCQKCPYHDHLLSSLPSP